MIDKVSVHHNIFKLDPTNTLTTSRLLCQISFHFYLQLFYLDPSVVLCQRAFSFVSSSIILGLGFIIWIESLFELAISRQRPNDTTLEKMVRTCNLDNTTTTKVVYLATVVEERETHHHHFFVWVYKSLHFMDFQCLWKIQIKNNFLFLKILKVLFLTLVNLEWVYVYAPQETKPSNCPERGIYFF